VGIRHSPERGGSTRPLARRRITAHVAASAKDRPSLRAMGVKWRISLR